MKPIEKQTIDALRVLSVEGVESANSGHPGMPMGTAPIAYTLWAKYLKFNPKNPDWNDRDRFVLSAGHGSMLLYSLLHLFGYGLTTDDLGSFRQLNSKTPGHPEFGHTVGVETTTGPLGQGLANSVGMAIAESYLAAKFNKENYDVVDHYTYAISGDGCMMEGLTSEAASLAGTLGLGKLIVFYDDNSITIEGSTDLAFREDVSKRFDAYNWQCLEVSDVNDIGALGTAIEEAKAETNKPTLIKVKTVIGYGSPELAGSHKVHGAPLGEANIKSMKEFLGWNGENAFEVPDEVYTHTNEIIENCAKKEDAWKALFENYKKDYPELAQEYELWYSGKLSSDLLNNEEYWKFDKKDATRNSSGQAINRLAELVPNLIGGSADLAPSNKSDMKNRGDFSAEDRTGSNLHFGIREHAMASIGNGIALHGGLKPYVATFFVFTDYMKDSMRLSAMMKQPVTYVLTHDSIGVGEDGPTHQPIEQLTGLRSVPNFTIFRPCDSHEVAAGWYLAMTKLDGPVGLVLSRQNLPLYDNTGINALRGAYVLKQSTKEIPDVILMASGSEVELVMEASKILDEKGISARVISVPSLELFDAQCDCYKKELLPDECRARVAVEAGHPMSWYKYTGLDGRVLGIDTFGASGDADELYKMFGLTIDNVVKAATEVIK